MRVMLTGATGMVGRNLLEHPEFGKAVSRLFAPTRAELNLLDYPSVVRFIEASQPDLIIHAAGTVGGIQANIRQPVRFLLDNLDMGRNVVAAARQAGVTQLINLGSSCMYPRQGKNPLQENAILTGELEPTNEGYALAKITVARLCEYIRREDPEFRYKTLIPCNLYGRWDKFDPARSHLIPAVIQKIHDAKINGSPKVDIWGDGRARREFMYAADLADCLVQAIVRFDSLPPLMNVGTGTDYSIAEYYHRVAAIIGYDGRFEYDTTKPIGMKRKVVSVANQKNWGWMPGTSLEEGIRKTYTFYLEREGYS